MVQRLIARRHSLGPLGWCTSSTPSRPSKLALLLTSPLVTYGPSLSQLPLPYGTRERQKNGGMLCVGIPSTTLSKSSFKRPLIPALQVRRRQSHHINSMPMALRIYPTSRLTSSNQCMKPGTPVRRWAWIVWAHESLWARSRGYAAS